MKHFLIAAAIGLVVGLILVSLARRRLLSEELSEDTGLEDALVSRRP